MLAGVALAAETCDACIAFIRSVSDSLSCNSSISASKSAYARQFGHWNDGQSG